MTNEWSDEFRAKFEGYSPDVPDDVWPGIESRLAFRKEQRRKRMAGLFLICSGMAASIFLILTFGIYGSPGPVNENNIAVVVPIKGQTAESVIADCILEKPEYLSFPERYVHSNENTDQNDLKSLKSHSNTTIEASDNKNIHDNRKKDSAADMKAADENSNHEMAYIEEGEFFTDDVEKTNAKTRKLGFGISASGFTSSSSSNNGYEGSIATKMNSGALVMGSSHIADLMLLNRYNQVTTESKHFQPLRVGLSVNYSLTERWKIGTGLNYSMLYSKHRTGSENEYYISKQVLHYIGLPLNLQFNVARSGDFNIYMSAGGAVEKCVSGSLHTEYYYLNGYRPSETEKLSVRPLQWSVNLSAGLQYDFNDFIGLYAEPGVSYHFKNNSTIETIYSDTPFNFYFSLGIRFSL